MSLHQSCSRAMECPWGSNTVPGTCGFTSCQRDKHFRAARNGDLISAHILVERGEMPGSNYVPDLIKNAEDCY